MDEPSVAGDLDDLFLSSLELAMFLDSREVVTDQRAQAGSVHLGHGGGYVDPSFLHRILSAP